MKNKNILACCLLQFCNFKPYFHWKKKKKEEKKAKKKHLSIVSPKEETVGMNCQTTAGGREAGIKKLY